MNFLKEWSAYHIKAILEDNCFGVLFHPLSVKLPIVKINAFAHVNSLLSGSFPPVLKVLLYVLSILNTYSTHLTY